MRGQFLLGALVVVGAVGSGSIECSPSFATPVERRGAELYARMCSVCHGAWGEGYRADQAPAVGHADFLATASDEFLRAAIADGRAGTTMSAWSTARGGPLTRVDMDAIILYLYSLAGRDRRQRVLDERPSNGDVARGEATYTKSCVACHGARGTGGPYIAIGGAQLLSTAGNGFLREAIRAGRTHTAMAAFGSSLGDRGIDDLVAMLRSWQASAVAAQRPPPARAAPIPLGPVPLNPKGPEPVGFKVHPGTTPADVIKAQLDRGAKMALLDARAPSDYVTEHIKGAVSVPFYDPDPFVSGLPKDAWLVAYCACPHAESGTLASKLVAKGFTKVTVLDEGLGVWRMRKYATSTGPMP
jgi:cytochrome c oxidase cbb3-type subunit 3